MAVDLKRFTPARVDLGRTGHSVPTSALLRFQMDHARARDAVLAELDPGSLGFEHGLLRSAAVDRATYLRRPDLGRVLRADSRVEKGSYDLAIVVSDGLSALAVHRHAGPVLEELRALIGDWRVAPIVVVLQGRVAIGDEVGERLGSRMVLVLIGERPGLSSPDSLGAYLTWDPRPERTDAERNCISNIRAEGVGYSEAARRIFLLMSAARVRSLTGVALKEDLPLLS
jgi:ethanolamine ammonia-lyase small subunit